MKNFTRVGQIETSIEPFDDGQKARTRGLESTNEHDDEVAVRIQFGSIANAIDDFTRSSQLFAHVENDFNWQEFAQFVN